MAGCQNQPRCESGILGRTQAGQKKQQSICIFVCLIEKLPKGSGEGGVFKCIFFNNVKNTTKSSQWRNSTELLMNYQSNDILFLC